MKQKLHLFLFALLGLLGNGMSVLAQGVTCVGFDDGCFVFELESGTYQFSTDRADGIGAIQGQETRDEGQGTRVKRQGSRDKGQETRVKRQEPSMTSVAASSVRKQILH